MSETHATKFHTQRNRKANDGQSPFRNTFFTIQKPQSCTFCDATVNLKITNMDASIQNCTVAKQDATKRQEYGVISTFRTTPNTKTINNYKNKTNETFYIRHKYEHALELMMNRNLLRSSVDVLHFKFCHYNRLIRKSVMNDNRLLSSM